jgi:hypothetical protein
MKPGKIKHINLTVPIPPLEPLRRAHTQEWEPESESMAEPAAEQEEEATMKALEQVALEAAEAVMGVAEEMMLPATAATPPSPVMDAPAPPRPAVVSEDTKTFDRGRRRREGTHTHTHTCSHFFLLSGQALYFQWESVVSIVRLTIKRINKAYHTHTHLVRSKCQQPSEPPRPVLATLHAPGHVRCYSCTWYASTRVAVSPSSRRVTGVLCWWWLAFLPST